LALEGLTFSGQSTASASGLPRQNWRSRATAPPPLSGETLVRGLGAPLLIIHCQFRSPWEAVGGRPGVADVTVSDSPYTELRHSRFATPWAKSLVAKYDYAGTEAAPPSARLIVSDCLLAGEDNLWLNLGPRSRMEIDLARSVWRERAAIVLGRAESPRSVVVNASRNVFTARYLVDDERSASDPALREVFRWEEDANLFSSVECAFVDAPGYPKAQRGLRAFTYWKEFCATTRAESVLGQFTLGSNAAQGIPTAPASSFLFVNGLVVVAGPASAAERPLDFGLEANAPAPGPQGYAVWRNSSAYAEWRTHVARVQAGNY
jgi:hypothetical protein